jgi:hypothetical protein
MRGDAPMTELAKKITSVAVKYLGLAAPVFLEQQTKMHLGDIQFETVEREPLHSLQYWVRISAGILIGKEKA